MRSTSNTVRQVRSTGVDTAYAFDVNTSDRFGSPSYDPDQSGVVAVPLA
jgi:hypothetical protein